MKTSFSFNITGAVTMYNDIFTNNDANQYKSSHTEYDIVVPTPYHNSARTGLGGMPRRRILSLQSRSITKEYFTIVTAVCYSVNAIISCERNPHTNLTDFT